MIKARTILHGAIDHRLPENNPDNKEYKIRILAEGDSWFTFGSIPGCNLLSELRFPEKAIVVSLGQVGDTIVNMGSRTDFFKRFVSNKNHLYKLDAILISGGGNDLINGAEKFIQRGNSAEKCIKQESLKECLEGIKAAYRNISRIRDSSSKNASCKIIAHTYDYCTPRNSPATFIGFKVEGPWLYRALNKKGVDRKFWKSVSDRLIDHLAEAIISLSEGKGAIKNFIVVDTRNTLVRADARTTGCSQDWENEIHPSQAGYRKLAVKIAKSIV